MRLLVVTGARALDVCHRPRLWARRTLLDAFARHVPDLVVHGDAQGPDTWAEELAAWARLARAVFSLGLNLGTRGLPHLRRPDGARLLKDAYRYRYSDPLGRNEAMVRWAADRMAEGHAVRVVGLRAPWSSTHGTAHALMWARNLDLEAESFAAPSEAWPEEDPSHEGQGGP